MQSPTVKELLLSGVLCAGMGPLVYYLIQKGFTSTQSYQLTMQQLHSHPEALETLGSPLKVHHPPLLDRDHFVYITDARLKIPVSGPKAKAHLYSRLSRGAPFQRWNLEEVVLELEDGQRIPVFAHSEE